MRIINIVVAAALLCAGCSRIMGTSGDKHPEPIRQYPDGADGLKSLFTDVLEAARKDDRDRVHDLLATTIMSDADLTSLFGPAGDGLTGRYHALMGTLVNRGAVELVAQVYDRKYDAVEVVRIDPTAADAAPEDRAIAHALTQPMPVYAVRIKRAGDQKGLRYDFFFYRGSKWLTGNQLGKFLK
jgi:hypothetical protein